MRKVLATTALLTAIALPAAASNSAHISIERNFQTQYPLSVFAVSIDHQEVCALDTGDDCGIGLAPGEYVLEVDVAHWLKSDEHFSRTITLSAGEELRLETGYGCETWVQFSPKIIGSCSGRLYVNTVIKEHDENPKGTPGYY